MVSGGYWYCWLYSPSTLRKSGMPDSVLTPAPPKNTMWRLSLIQSWSCFCFSSMGNLSPFWD